MKRALISFVVAAALFAGWAGATGLYQYAQAQGEAAKAAELDAGTAPGPKVEITGGELVAETHLDPETRPTVAPPASTTTTITTTTTPASPSPLPDAVEDPESYLDVLYDLWRSGAGVVAALAGFLGLGVYLRRQRGWFKQGWQALAFATFATGVTTLVQMAASGITPNAKMIFAVFAGLALAAIKTYGTAPEPKS